MNKTPPKQNDMQRAKAEALRSVDLTGTPGSALHNPALSVAAVNAFNSTANQIKSKASDEDDDKTPMEELPTVPAPQLTDEQVKQSLEMSRILMRNDAIAIAEAARDLEDRQKEEERFRQIESQLKPIELSKLLYDGSCVQMVPVCDEYSLTFDLPPSELDLVIADVSNEYTERFSKTGKQPLSVNWVTRVATLACSLIRIGDTPTGANKLLSMMRSGTAKDDDIRAEVLALLKQMISKPTVLLQLWVRHHTMFVVRVRNVLNHAGYVENQTGK